MESKSLLSFLFPCGEVIISRTPLRITLGGGGTDLPFYYSKYGGYVVTAAIDKFVNIAVNKRFENNIRVSYTKTEIVDRPEQLEHPILREALKLLKINSNLEIVSLADVPSNTGLGSSGSFTVGLLNCLHTYLNSDITKKDLAEQACDIEMNILKEPVGKQDQYIAALGGVISLEIDRSGQVKASSLDINQDTIENMTHNLIFFFTNKKRSALEVITDQQSRSQQDDSFYDALNNIKDIGYRVKKSLEQGDIDDFGRLMHEHWLLKKKTSTKMSDPFIDKAYDLARENGSLGGKLVGAGGGGFLVFYCNSIGVKAAIRKGMAALGLNEVRIKFEPAGTKIVMNA